MLAMIERRQNGLGKRILAGQVFQKLVRTLRPAAANQQ